MKSIALIFFLLTNAIICKAQISPSDVQATPETRRLFTNMYQLMDKGYLVGHQDDLAYGVKWKYKAGRSDVKEVTGDYPGLYGWELGNLELGDTLNLDGVPFNKMARYITEGYERGGVITISWHTNNPFSGKSAWDPAPGSVKAILPGGQKHELFKTYLDKVAAFLITLKDKDGKAIPLLWRPFHENTGGWFWWGVNSCTNEEYIALFRFSVDYLRNIKGLHNLLIGFNSGTELSSEDEFLKRYPGDEYVDFISFDTYQRGAAVIDSSFIRTLDNCLDIIVKLASEKNKIPAIGEIGFNQIPYPYWFTQVLAPVFKKYKFSYVLFWRNAGYKAKENEIEYYIPYKGHQSAADFLNFYHLNETLFERDLRSNRLY